MKNIKRISALLLCSVLLVVSIFAKGKGKLEGEYSSSFISLLESQLSVDKEKVTSEELLSSLKEMNSNELRLIRNLQFALHGYNFKSKNLQDFFSQFEWYKPRVSNEGIELTKEEQHIVNLCLNLEKQIKENGEKGREDSSYTLKVDDFLSSFFDNEVYKVTSVKNYDKPLFFARSIVDKNKDIFSKGALYLLKDGMVEVLVRFDGSNVSNKNGVIFNANMPGVFWGWNIKMNKSKSRNKNYIIATPYSNKGDNVADIIRFEQDASGQFIYKKRDFKGLL